MRGFTAQNLAERTGVVCVDLRIVSGARNRYVGQMAVDELRVGGFTIDVDQDTVAVVPWLLWLVTA
jgi:hypothetical protein